MADLSQYYANVGGTIYNKGRGAQGGFATPDEFFKDSGQTSFQGLTFDTQWKPPGNSSGSTIGSVPGAQPTNPPNPPPLPGGSGDVGAAYGQIKDLSQNVPNTYDLYKKELDSRGVNTLIDQEAELGKAALEQEKALKPLLPENVRFNFPTSMKQFQDIGVTQDQLDLLAAKERTPIAAGLADLLKSQSIIAQQIDRQMALSQHAVQLKQDDYNAQLQAARLQHSFAQDSADRAQQTAEQSLQVQNQAKQFALETGVTTPFYNMNGTIYRTSDGKVYSSPEDFFRDANVPSFQAAYHNKLVSDLSPQSVAAFQTTISPSRKSSSGSSGSGGSGGSGSFTNTQINKGASAAGMSIEAFKQLPADDKNFFINGQYDDFIKEIDKEIAQYGRDILGELRDEIDNSNLPQWIKEQLKVYVESQVPEEEEDSGWKWPWQ